MHARIPRVLPLTAEMKDFSITSIINGIMHPELARRCDALIILNGRDEPKRLCCGLGMWQEHTACFHHLYISRSFRSRFLKNVNSPKDISAALYPGVIPTLFERTRGVILSEQLLEDTKEEALWAADLVLRHKTRSIAFVTSPEHAERVCRTFVRQFGLKRIRIPIIPVNTHIAMPPGRVVIDGEDGKPSRIGWDYYSGENKRLSEYEKCADIAAYEQMREYFDWLYDQPIMREIPCI